MAYCIQCDANTNYYIKDVWGTRTVQRNIYNNNNEVTGYIEENVECIIRKDPLCCECNSYIKHTNANTRKDFLQIEEDNIFEENVFWPILILLFLCIGFPLGAAVWNWASGLGALVSTVCVGGILPVFLARLIISNMAHKHKRLMAFSVSTIKSAAKFGFWGFFAGIILSLILVGLHVPKVMEPFIVFGTFCAFVFLGVRKDISELRALFDIFDEQLYEKVEGAYEEMNNDDGIRQEDVDHNLVACYAVFELSPSATMGEVNERYRKMMMKFHPDKLEHIKNKFPNEYQRSQEISRKINAAYAYIKERREGLKTA